MNGLFEELKHRNVFRVGIAYLALAWLVIQITSIAVPALNLPETLNSIVFYLGLIGFPFALLLAWAFELTPDGLKRSSDVADDVSIRTDTSRKLNYLVIGILLLLVAITLWQGQTTVLNKVEAVVDEPVRSSDVISDVDAVREKSANLAERPSIAVLAFEDFSPDGDQEYFGDGIAEEILNLLVKTDLLTVIGRTSSFSFKHKQIDIPTIADTLNVNNIVEGSISKSGNKIKVTVQLVTKSGSHLWSETYKRDLVDIFELQEEVAQAIVSTLKLKLLPAQRLVLKAANPIDAEAYNQYLLGLSYSATGSIEGWRNAKVALEKVIALEPDFAPAYIFLAYVESQLIYEAKTSAEIFTNKKRALKIVEKAIALDPLSDRAYVVRSMIRKEYFDFAGSLDDVLRALELNPSGEWNQLAYGNALMDRGHLGAGLVAMRKAADLDPLSFLPHWGIGLAQMSLGHYPQAQEVFQRVLQYAPISLFPNHALGLVHLLQGNLDDAQKVFLSREHAPLRNHGLTLVQYSLGHKKEADDLLAKFIASYEMGWAYQIAEIYAWQNKKDLAFKWLQRAYDQKDGGLAMLNRAPLLSSLRDDPRFSVLIEKLGLARLDFID